MGHANLLLCEVRTMKKLIIFIVLYLINGCWNDGPSESRYFSPLSNGWKEYVYINGNSYYLGLNNWFKEDLSSPWRGVTSKDNGAVYSYAKISTNYNEDGSDHSFTIQHVTESTTNEFILLMPEQSRLDAIIPNDDLPTQKHITNEDYFLWHFSNNHQWDGHTYILRRAITYGSDKIYVLYSWIKNNETGIDDLTFLYSTEEALPNGQCEEIIRNGAVIAEEKCIQWEGGKLTYKTNPLKVNSKLSHYKNTFIEFANSKSNVSVKRYGFTYAIDKDYNLHLLYTTDEMVKNKVKHYVQYSFFYHDDPMTPYYSQKLYLNE